MASGPRRYEVAEGGLMAQRLKRLNTMSTEELGDLIDQALHELSERPELSAFEQLLKVSEQIGHCLGQSARVMAAEGSWSQVADAAGTTKQAAWSRWREP